MISKAITWTSVPILGIGSIPIFGFDVVILGLLIYTLLELLDVSTGVTKSKEYQVVHSSKFIDGFVKKTRNIAFLVVFTLLFGLLSKMIDNEYLKLIAGIIPLICVWLFILGALKSLVENMAVTETGSNKMIYTVLSFLASKLFNMSLKQIQERGIKKINKLKDD